MMAVLLPTVVGDFVDLSLGSSLGLSAMTLAVLNVQHGWPVLVACLAGIGAAVIVGLINVFFVVFFDNDPFIVTLGTMTIVQGVIYIVSGSNSVGIVSTNLSNWIFTNDFLSIPLEFYYGLAIFLVVWYVLSFTPTGQKALVIGQSREVARLSGVRVNRQRSWAYILGAAIAGIAGIAYAGTNGTIDPTAGSALILPAYAAVFLGATAIKPGRINPLGALIAVYFLATGTAGLRAARHADLLPADLLRRRAGRGDHDPEGEPRALLQAASEPPERTPDATRQYGAPSERKAERNEVPWCRRSVRRARPGGAGHRGRVRPRLRVRVDPGRGGRDRGHRRLGRRRR